VLDSSVALSWCFEDERTAATLALLDRLVEEGATVPALWPLEVLNGLAMAERRRRLDRKARLKLCGFLQRLPVSVDLEGISLAWTDTLKLSDRFGLTTYDATYLELAQRLQLPLGTLDEPLRKAAGAAKVALVG
jgi:predicted nucleic acid-binding protein